MILLTILLAVTQPTPVEPIIALKAELGVSSPVPTDFKPNENSIRDALTEFDKFWALRNQGKSAEAFAMLSDKNRAQINEADWIAQQERSLAEVGPDTNRQVIRITWYPNPPTADAKGLYAAVDFVALTKKNGFRCGYVVLVADGSDSAPVVRTDTTDVPAQSMDGKLPRSDIVSQLPCYLGPNIKTAFGKSRP
jgi:Protein of unknown function (DUF4019)